MEIPVQRIITFFKFTHFFVLLHTHPTELKSLKYLNFCTVFNTYSFKNELSAFLGRKLFEIFEIEAIKNSAETTLCNKEKNFRNLVTT